MDKNSRLKQVALLSKLSCFNGFKKISDFEGGIFDCENYVSPWSIGAHNANADLMLVGQDWASSKWLSNPENQKYAHLGRDPGLVTNKNLDEYLALFDLKFSDTYATNAFVFIKEGNMDARIPSKLLYESIKNFLFPQIEIIKPKMVICLGSSTFNAIRRLNGYPQVKIGEGHRNPISLMGSEVYGAHHTGGHGTKNAGGKVNAALQWQLLADEFKKFIYSK